VRLSEFHNLMIDEFGSGYSEIILRDLYLQELQDKTPNQALADGDSPKEIWLAICRAQEVPKSRWAGKPVLKNKRDTL